MMNKTQRNAAAWGLELLSECGGLLRFRRIRLRPRLKDADLIICGKACLLVSFRCISTPPGETPVLIHVINGTPLR